MEDRQKPNEPPSLKKKPSSTLLAYLLSRVYLREKATPSCT